MEMSLGTSYPEKNLGEVEQKLRSWLLSLNGKVAIVFCSNERVLRLLQWCERENKDSFSCKIEYYTARYFQDTDNIETLTVDETYVRKQLGLEEKEYDAFFNDLVTSKALSLGVPMDVECPLFYSDIPDDVADKEKYFEEFVGWFTPYISDSYGNGEVLIIPVRRSMVQDPITGEKHTTYTLLYDQLSPSVMNDNYYEVLNSFKLRFFLRGNRITIASYNAESLYHVELKENSSYISDWTMRDAWNRMYKSLVDGVEKGENTDRGRMEFLPAMCNYFRAFMSFKHFSFSFVCHHKCKLIEGRREDLAVLFGESAALSLLYDFDNIHNHRRTQADIRSGSATRVTSRYTVRRVNPLTPTSGALPFNGIIDFNLETSHWMNRNDTIESLVNAEFSSMKHIFNSLGINLSDKGYGESVNGIMGRIRANSGRESLYETEARKEVLMEMDRLMDYGALKSKYILYSEPEKLDRWIQVFSYTNGETIHHDRLLRCLVYLYSKLRSGDSEKAVKRYELEFLLIVLNKMNLSETLLMIESEAKLSEYDYHLLMKDRDGGELSLIDFAKARGVLMETENGELLPGRNQTYYKQLNTGAPWDDFTNSDLDGYVDMVLELRAESKNQKEDTEELLNIMCFDKDVMVGLLTSFSEKMADLLASERKSKPRDAVPFYRAIAKLLALLPSHKSDAMKVIGKVDNFEKLRIKHLLAKIDLNLLLMEKIATMDYDHIAQLRESMKICSVSTLLLMIYGGLFDGENIQAFWSVYYKHAIVKGISTPMDYGGTNPASPTFIADWKQLGEQEILSLTRNNISKAVKKCSH